MKKLLMMFVMISSLSIIYAETVQLKSFNELMKALKQGEKVRVVANYGKCKLISNNEVKNHVPNAIGGMNIDVFEYFAKMTMGNKRAFVVFSHSSLINYGGYTYDYTKFKVYDDGEVKITAQYANPTDFKIDMNENFFSKINDGKNVGAVYFYKLK